MTGLAQPTVARRLRAWFTVHHVAQIMLLIQPLIVVRTGGEYLRLKWAGTDALPALIEPLFLSLAGVGVVAIVSLVLYFNRRDGAVVALTLAGIAALIVYKLIALPTLG